MMNKSSSMENLSRGIQRNRNRRSSNTVSTTSHSSGRESSTNKNETITIDLTTFYSTHSPQSPLGMLLAPQKQKNVKNSNQKGDVIVVAGWEKLRNGRLGPVQKSGAVLLGDHLIQVNRIDIVTLKFQEVMGLLRSFRENGSLRSLTFVSRKRGVGYEEKSSLFNNKSVTISSSKRKYTFSSTITGVQIIRNKNEVKSEKNNNKSMKTLESSTSGSDVMNESEKNQNNEIGRPYAEYKIECELLTRGYGGELTETAWELWRRFSQFQELYDKLFSVYGWQLAEATSQTPFPSKKTLTSLFLLNSRMRTNFVENRRMELEKFWQSMLKIEELTDFAQSHRYSRDLATFLSIEEYLNADSITSKAISDTTELNGQENLLCDDSTSSGDDDGNIIPHYSSPPLSLPSIIQNKPLLNKNRNSASIQSTSKPSYRLKQEPLPFNNTYSHENGYKNRIPAKSSFKRHNPCIVGSSSLVFGQPRFLVNR